MKSAYVHDRIVVTGGAEQVFFDLIRQDAPDSSQTLIFTLFSSQDRIQIGDHQYPIVSALPKWIVSVFERFARHRIPLLSILLDYRNLMVIRPQLLTRLSSLVAQYQPDHLLVSSFAIVKNIRIPSSVQQSSLYAHSPCMYIHNHYQSNYDKLPAIFKPVYAWTCDRIRQIDHHTDRYHQIYANSHYTADLFQQIYHLSAQVRYPRIDQALLDTQIPLNPSRYPRLHHRPYMLMIGRLVRFARQCDTVIRLCNDLCIDLVVMGTGPDEAYLRSIAGPTIHFLGYVDDIQTKIAWIGHAQGLINLTLESFGIGTAECLALGIPVYANQQGASTELVTPGSGLLVDTTDYISMSQTLRHFADAQRDHLQIRYDFIKTYRGEILES